MLASSLYLSGMATLLVAPLLAAAATPLALAGASPLTTSAAPLTTVLLSAVAADSSTVAPKRDAKQAFRREKTPACGLRGCERRAGGALERWHISRLAAAEPEDAGVENPETSTMPPEPPFAGADMDVTAAATNATEMATHTTLAAGGRCLPRRLVR